MNRLIANYLLNLGFNPIRSGYKYLIDLIELYLYGNIMPLKNIGYKIIAEKYEKSIDTIDKNIQNCISYVWLRGDLVQLEKEFGSTIDSDRGKPTNKQLIATLGEKIKNLSS